MSSDRGRMRPIFCRIANPLYWAGAVLLLLSCELDRGALRRAAADYFPLRTGTEWRYDIAGTTSIVQVGNDTVAHNQPAIVILQDFAEQYWRKHNGRLAKFVDSSLNRGGTDYPLEQRYRLFYELPFVLGNNWTENFCDTLVILGETIPYAHSISGAVVGTDAVSVPAGNFRQCYEISLNEAITIGDSSRTVLTQEWYAPGVGLVKRIQGDREEVLTEYHIP